ncbi:MAG: ComEC family competence protein [Prevotellaceae bacterium]|jgi:competence protein ComEC|nr:ComEC family competence protein [Prevotellaceae bacterium]
MNFSHILQKVPFVRFLIPLTAGIILNVFGLDFESCLLFFTLAALLIAFSFLTGKQCLAFRFRWTFGLGITFFFVALGMFLSSNKQNSLKIPFAGDNQERLFLAEIIENPQQRSNSIQCLVTLSPLNENKTEIKDDPNPVKAILYIRKDSASTKLQYGNTLLISHNFGFRTKTLNPEEFDYEEYLHKKGISTSIYIPSGKWQLLFSQKKFSLFNKARQVQLKLMSVYQDFGISGEEFAVLSALTLGNKEYIDRDLQSSYSATGAAHILAVSGMHVGVVCVVFKFLLGFFFKGNRFLFLEIIILISALWSYAFITGLSPSVVRATVMFSFVGVGMLLQRKSLIYNTISASAFWMLLYNPFYLFDVSFQLSYVAVLFIVFFQPYIYRLLHFKNWLPDRTWNLFAVSVAAQLGTFPFAVYYFHQFPNYFWLSGFVVIPAAAIIIYLSISLFALSWFPFPGKMLAFLLNWVLKIMNFSIRFIEELPFAQFREICFEPYDLFFIYASLLLLAFYLAFRRYRYATLFISCLLVYFSVDTINYHLKTNQEIFVVYNIPNVSAVNKIENGKNQLYYQGDFQEIQKRAGNFWIKNRVPKPEQLTGSYFTIGNKKAFVLTDDFYKKHQTNSPLSVDFLVLSNNASYTISELCGLFRFETLIVDSSNSYYQAEKWKEQCREMNIACYVVREKGAYLFNAFF